MGAVGRHRCQEVANHYGAVRPGAPKIHPDPSPVQECPKLSSPAQMHLFCPRRRDTEISSRYGIHHVWEELTMAQGQRNKGKSSPGAEVSSGDRASGEGESGGSRCHWRPSSLSFPPLALLQVWTWPL